ncbi:PREDICTED: FAM206 family protein CG9288 [Bactrocera latifrons]|uniref:FAM206 family protein CG9288 n=1 Tax=Bactrocera latifrons TaxID=174628 RepID=A0A0K8VI32_BACLA|nr:PREDICTED: FAM206 family protein CG9288 [Bactrocera latifrons]
MPTEPEDPLEPYYYNHVPEVIGGITVPSITEEWVENYPSVVDRFFTRYYYIKESPEPAPYQVLFHSNRVCLICLAPEHPAIKDGIKSFTFDIGNTDRSKNTVKGKGKKGGMVLQHDSTLAILTSEQNKTYKIPSCVQSKLVEVNTAWVEAPKRLETAAEGEGYVAIVLPKPEDCENIKRSLLTQAQYNEKWSVIKMKAAQKLADESNVAKSDHKSAQAEQESALVEKQNANGS